MMRRSSLAKLMAVVALLAVNFATYRFVTNSANGSEFTCALIVGFIPLVDVLLMVAFLAASQIRICVQSHFKDQRGRVATLFLFIGTTILLKASVVAFQFPDLFRDYLKLLNPSFFDLLQTIEYQTHLNSNALRYVIAFAFLGFFLSGPPLILSLVVASIGSRLRLTKTHRSEQL